MLCPRCRGVAVESSWRSRVRREGKDIWVQAKCGKCSSCRTSTGPLTFLTPALEDENERIAAADWQNTFSETIPRPVAGERIRRLMRTPEGRAQVLRAFERALTKKIQERTHGTE